MFEHSVLGIEPVYAPGEAVVILASDVAKSIETSIPTVPLRGGYSGVTAFGVSEVDEPLVEAGVADISKVHAPTPTPPLGLLASTVEDTLASTFRVRFDPARPIDEVVHTLGDADGVEVAEPVLLREAFAVPNDTLYGTQWGLSKIRCPEAWDRTTGDPGVVVAVVDTGVDLDHPDLAPLVLAGFDVVDRGTNPPPFQVQGQTWVWEGDFSGKDNVPQDEVGHGTHVAGTISAVTNNGVGVAGVTWRCPLLPVKVLCRARRVSDNRISGFGFSDEIAEGIRWAADHGARVINLSLGAYQRTIVEANAIAYAVSRGCVVVAAMGNDNVATPSFPAAYPNVLAVAAVDSADRKASFSNVGPHVGVAAPGVGIQSTYWDNTYASANGTSMAAPHVAGVAALALSCDPSQSEAQVRQVIRDTARPLRDDASDPVPNDRYGSGLVDAHAAINRACPPREDVKSERLIDCLFPESVPVFRCRSDLFPCLPGTLSIRCFHSVRFPCLSTNFGCPPSLACPSEGAAWCPDSRWCEAPGLPADPPDERWRSDDPYRARFGHAGGW